MSYTSLNTLDQRATVTAVKNLIQLLGYAKYSDGLSVPGRIGYYFWTADCPNISFVGVELDICKNEKVITVETRTRAGRSYWDIEQQNKTIKYLHDFFGGVFETDEGKSRYLYRNAAEPSKLASGLYLSRWIFHNALMKPQLYLMCRTLEGDISKENPTGIAMFDDINPRFFSNSMVIPYIIGAWEEYLRSSFVVLLRYADCNPQIYRLAKIRPEDIEAILKQGKRIENQIADSLSFQRPKITHLNFKSIDERLDITGCLRKPYHRRKKSLYDFIEELVEVRNKIVHTATNSMFMKDDQINRIITDFEASANRIYDMFGFVYGFTPDKSF